MRRIRQYDLLPIGFILLGSLPLLWLSLQHFDGIQWFGFAILPFILRLDKREKGGSGYLWLGLLFTAFNALLGQTYWAFAAGLSLIYHLLNTRVGKLNAVAFYTIIFYLPLTKSFFTLFGFHIRMFITKWAGVILSFFDDSVTYFGSRIWIEGAEFTVDAGCMGLRLVITGFLLTLLIVQQVFKRKGITPKTYHLGMFLSASFVLVIVANFARILMVIAFRSAPETWSHELIGLSSFLKFHVIPMYLLVSRTIKPSSKQNDLPTRTANRGMVDLWMASLLVCLMLSKSVYAPGKARFATHNIPSVEIPGFELEAEMDGVKRYTNGDAILLIKPMFPLSFSNHHPMLCWRGDGYDVQGEAMDMIGEKACYRANLVRGSEKLETAWWYSTGNGNETTGEWEWRWKALTKGDQFYLVNFVGENTDQILFTMNYTKNGQLAFGSTK